MVGFLKDMSVTFLIEIGSFIYLCHFLFCVGTFSQSPKTFQGHDQFLSRSSRLLNIMVLKFTIPFYIFRRPFQSRFLLFSIALVTLFLGIRVDF